MSESNTEIYRAGFEVGKAYERAKMLAAIRAIPELLDDKGRSIYVAYDVYRVIMDMEAGK